MEDVETKMMFNDHARKYLDIFKEDVTPFMSFVLTCNVEIL